MANGTRLFHRSRRFILGENTVPGIGAYEDFESQTLNFGDWHLGWLSTGIVYSYIVPVAYEDFETQTVTSTVLPVFGWFSGGIVTLQVLAALPASVPLPLGGTTTITVTITTGGVSPFTYQWKKAGVALTNVAPYSGVTTATLTFTNPTSSQYDNYTVTVTDALGRSVTSTTAVVKGVGAEWSARVQANGGAAPSGGTISAIDTFAGSLASSGVWTKINTMNVFAPDSLIACMTPLKVGGGFDPWTNHNFVLADLSVNGLVGNASNKTLNIGLNPATAFATLTAGLAWYAKAVTATGFTMGCYDGTHDLISASKYSDNNAYSYNSGSSGASASVASPGAGFYFSTRVSSTDHRLYFANSSNAFAQKALDSTSATGAYLSQPMFMFCVNLSSGSVQLATSDSYSFGAVLLNATSTDGSNLFTAVQALRTSFGGGFV